MRALSLRAATTPRGAHPGSHATDASKVEGDVDLCEVLNASGEEFRNSDALGRNQTHCGREEGRAGVTNAARCSATSGAREENPTPKPNESPLLSGRWRLVFDLESILGRGAREPFGRRDLQDINAESSRQRMRAGC